MDHTVTAFDDDLRLIIQRVTEMGGNAESMVGQSVSALTKGDIQLAEAVIAQDTILDDLQVELDSHAILVIAKRQPMADDLREIIGALRMANDLERIGDLGTNIARRALEMDGAIPPKKQLRGLQHLTDLALEQLKDVLDAYVNRDIEKAQAVWLRDDEIDEVYTSLFRELLTYMMEDPRKISNCTHLLFCAKNIERIGDHATNLAETIHFMATGLALDAFVNKQAEEKVDKAS